AFDHDCAIKHAGRRNNNREACAVRLLDVERCLRPWRSVPSLPDNRLLDPLSRSSIMEELMLNKSAPLQSDPTSAGAADAAVYVKTNLISDVAAVGAAVTDPNLVNPWGVSFRQGSPFWISEQGKNSATVYSVNSTGVVSHVFTVNIPTTATGPQGPTGQ